MEKIYVIINPSGIMMVTSCRWDKTGCIKNFMDQHSAFTWKDAYKVGWRCKKATVNFNI